MIETAGGGSDLYSEYLGEGIQAVLMETEPAIATTASNWIYTNLLFYLSRLLPSYLEKYTNVFLTLSTIWVTTNNRFKQRKNTSILVMSEALRRILFSTHSKLIVGILIFDWTEHFYEKNI